jgi:acyl-CoA synthetase
VGQENPDIEAKPGELGEIGTRGALLTLGYFNNQSATENSFNASGWFLSGDLGRLDAEGNLQIVGRKKDLIIRGGHNIYPAHIENLTVKHPAVLKAAAFPIADERLGERVCLAIIARDGTRPTPPRCSTTSASTACRNTTCPNISSPWMRFRRPRAARY